MQITINGKVIGIKFNQWAYQKYAEAISGKTNKVASVYGYVYAGYHGWKFVKEEAPGSSVIVPAIEFEEIVDWVDEAAIDEKKYEELGKIRELFIGNPIFLKILKMVEEEEKKSQINEEDLTQKRKEESLLTES